MNRLADREIKSDRMLDTGGLMPLATGARVRIADGHLSVVDGRFVEAKEVIGYPIFELRNKEEALALAVEFMQQGFHAGFVHVWTVRDGRIAKFDMHTDTAKVLEALKD